MNRNPGQGQPARGNPAQPQRLPVNPSGARPASRDGAGSRGTLPTPSSTANQAVNVGSQPVMADFDWDDDDDFDEDQLVQATQAAEDAARPPSPKPATSRLRAGYQRSPAKSSDRIPLEMRRLELAMQGRSADSAVQMHEIMPGGVLGGDIGRQKEKPPEEEVKELKAAFNVLQQQNYQSKGEATLLRRKLEEEQKRWNTVFAQMQLRQEASQKENSKKVQDTSKEKENLQSAVRMQQQELRELEERCKALQKRLRHFENAATQATQAIQASQMQQNMSLNASALNMSLTGSKRPPGKPLSSLGFAAVPTQGSQATVLRPPLIHVPAPKEVATPPTPTTTPTPVTPKETTETSAQTDLERTETVTVPDDEMQKILQKKTELFQKVANVVRSVAAEHYFKAMLVMRNLPETAEDEVIRKMNIKGFPYTLFFPENVKLAEVIRDKKASSPNPKLLPLLPSELTDWPNVSTESVDNATSQYLLVQEDYWAAVVFAETELAKCIQVMRTEKSENRIYRRKNLECFVKLMALGAALWKLYIPQLCFFWGWTEGNELREKYLHNIKSWTTSALWVGYRKLLVESADIEMRKMSLQLLSDISSKSALFCTPLTYFRIYHIVHDTLTRKEHQTSENLLTCLRLVTFIHRRLFYLKYFCRKKNDHTCLAYALARLGLQIFRSEKNFLKKHDLYVEYLSLMLELRDYCTEHLNGSEPCEQSLLKEDSQEGFETCNRVRSGSQMPTSADDADLSEEMDTSQSKSTTKRAEVSGIHSFYGYEEIEEEMEVEDDEVQIINDGKPDSASDVFKVPQVPASTSMESTKATRHSEPNTEELRGGYEFPKMNISKDSSAVTSEVKKKVRRFFAIDGFDTSRKYCAMELLPEPSRSCDNDDASQIPCRRLLDSASWEQPASAATPSTICQCRLYFMQTFMIMTECMVHIWHHVFMKEKVEESSKRYDNSKWKTQLDEVIEEMRAEKANSSQNSSINSEKRLRNSKLWKQIREDGTRPMIKMTSAAVSSSLGSATEILYDSFMAVVNDVKLAFGRKGTTALYSAAIQMWGHSADLNFSTGQRKCLMTLCEELDKGMEPPSSYDSECSASTSSEVSSLQSAATYAQRHLKPFQDVAPRRNLDFRKFPPEELLSKVPKVVLQACLEVESKKKQAIDSYMSQHAEEIDSATTSEDLVLGGDSPTISDDEEGFASNTEFVCEDSDTEDKDRTLDAFPVQPAAKPKLVLGNTPRKQNPSHRNVTDYESFCSKGLDDPSTAESFFLDPEIPIEEALPKWTKDDYSRMIEQQINQQKDADIKRCYMTAAEAQELLKKNPNLETLPGPKISAEYMESLMASCSIPGYYERERELTTDIDSDPLPFDI